MRWLERKLISSFKCADVRFQIILNSPRDERKHVYFIPPAIASLFCFRFIHPRRRRNSLPVKCVLARFTRSVRLYGSSRIDMTRPSADIFLRHFAYSLMHWVIFYKFYHDFSSYRFRLQLIWRYRVRRVVMLSLTLFCTFRLLPCVCKAKSFLSKHNSLIVTLS